MEPLPPRSAAKTHDPHLPCPSPAVENLHAREAWCGPVSAEALPPRRACQSHYSFTGASIRTPRGQLFPGKLRAPGLSHQAPQAHPKRPPAASNPSSLLRQQRRRISPRGTSQVPSPRPRPGSSSHEPWPPNVRRTFPLKQERRQLLQ